MDAHILGGLIVALPIFLWFFSWYTQILIIGGAVAYYLLTPASPKQNARAVAFGKARPGEGAIRRNIHSIGGLLDNVHGMKTVPELFQDAVEKFSSYNSLGFRKTLRIENKLVKVEERGKMVEKTFKIPVLEDYQFISYGELADTVARFGSGLVELSLQPRDKVSIFAETRPEWQIAAQACLAHNFPIVTVYASLGAEAVAYSFDQAKTETIITEASLVGTVFDALKENKIAKTVIYFDKVDEAKIKEYASKFPRVTLMSFDQVIKSGAAKTAPIAPPVADDLAMIMYTSGTSGPPKGVMVSHRNMVSAVAGISAAIPYTADGRAGLNNEDVYIAYLPLAHILEFSAELVMLTVGATIGYGNSRTLKDALDADGRPKGDIVALRPTLMAAVPLILDRLKLGVQQGVEAGGPVLSTLFKVAYYFKQHAYLRGAKSPFWDKLVFDKVAAKFGGRLRYMISGSAPLSADTQKFMNICLSCPVLQGYGLTETCASGTVCHPHDLTFGRVGPPLGCCEIKLVDVPEMGYVSGEKRQAGEILFSGPNISMGYFENKEKTDEVYKKMDDGKIWFHTGDIGLWHPDGTLQIIDRKKDLVKLCHGEYIALGRLESVFMSSPYIDQICVFADSAQSFPVAVVIPNPKAVCAYALSQGVDSKGTLTSEVCNNAAVIAEVLKSLNECGTKAKFNKCELLGKIKLTTDLWTPQNEILTEALKLKRPNAVKKYKSDFEALYKA